MHILLIIGVIFLSTCRTDSRSGVLLEDHIINSNFDLRTGLSKQELKYPNFKFIYPLYKEENNKQTSLPVYIGRGFSDYVRHKEFYSIKTSPYIHKGIDFRANAGTKIRAIMGGFAICDSTKSNPKHQVIRIHELDKSGHKSGRLWEYAHIERSSIPEQIIRAGERGVLVKKGEYIGKVVRWWDGSEEFKEPQIDLSDNKRFDHVHIS